MRASSFTGRAATLIFPRLEAVQDLSIRGQRDQNCNAYCKQLFFMAYKDCKRRYKPQLSKGETSRNQLRLALLEQSRSNCISLHGGHAHG